MNLRQLEFFVTLSEMEHMTQAATALNTTQPNLSHAMNELEKELGVPLFEKKGRNIALTKYGRFFLSYAKRSLNELHRGEQALKELVSPTLGHICFGFIYTLGAFHVPPLLQSFKNIPENKDITFSLRQGTTEDMINQLLTQEIDLALCSLKAEDPRIDFEQIIEQELILITALDHPLANKNEVPLEQIVNYPFISFSKKSGLRPIVDRLFKEAQLQLPEFVLETDEDHTVAGFVQHNFGVAIMPNISTLSSFNVKVLKISDLPFKRYIYLAKLKDKYLSPATLKFHNFALDYMRHHFLENHNCI